MKTRAKICGLTKAQDVSQASAIGADAIGFVFYPKSKRYVSPEIAGELSQSANVFIDTVALFVEPDDEQVEAVLRALRPSYLQFHGDETPEECERFGHRYIKAFRVGAPGLDTPEGLYQTCTRFKHAAAWLFDSYTPAYGGSGYGFDRTLLKDVCRHRNVPIILSGGLDADNVTGLITQLRPDAVDISSGVEIEPGIKSPQKMRDFLRAVSAAQSF